MAFNSKNLHYEKNEPAFLRKLRSEHGNDRQDFQAARPKRSGLMNDEDDGPAMVDEEGATVSKDDYDAMVKGKEDDAKATVSGGDTLVIAGGKISPTDDAPPQKVPKEQQQVADVGAVKKRKQVKVVGEETEVSEIVGKKGKPAKKPKKVKLSFDEPEDWPGG